MCGRNSGVKVTALVIYTWNCK